MGQGRPGIVSGFHSPLEQQVLRSVLRRKGRVVKVPAHGISEYRPTAEEREPVAAGRMLVITAARRKCAAPPAKLRWRAIDWYLRLPTRPLHPMSPMTARLPRC